MKVTLNIMYNDTIQSELLNYIRYGNIIEDNEYITNNGNHYRFLIVGYNGREYEIEMVNGDFIRVEIMDKEN